MKPHVESTRLLEAVLSDAAPEEFRAASLTLMLATVRRRRRHRQFQRGAAVVVTMLIVAGAAWQWVRSPGSPAAPTSPRLVEVTSEPLAATLIVTTTPRSVTQIGSAPETVNLLASEPGGERLRELSDDELLGLVAGQPAALVRIGGQAQLVFAAADGERTGSRP